MKFFRVVERTLIRTPVRAARQLGRNIDSHVIRPVAEATGLRRAKKRVQRTTVVIATEETTTTAVASLTVPEGAELNTAQQLCADPDHTFVECEDVVIVDCDAASTGLSGKVCTVCGLFVP
jgi:uncharacterized protein (DUF1778 family)